jgi:protein-disulfide isomerase
MKRYLPFAIIAGVFVISLSVGTLLFFHLKQRSEKTAANISSGTPGAEPPHVRGESKAPVTIEEFGDFQCLPCATLWSALKKVEADYGAKLRVVFRQFPLQIHRHAFEAACAAEAAGLQGRFWEMHDLLYRSQFLWSAAADVRAAFSDYATKLGLDVDRFKKDIDSEQVKARIGADRQRAASLGVDRTPAVFVNHRRLPDGPLGPSALHEQIDGALSTKKR